MTSVAAVSVSVLNMGTSCQIAVLLPTELAKTMPSGQTWCFSEDKSLIVAASMNGGGVLAEFVRMIIQWTSELGTTHRMNPLRRKTPTQTSVHLYFQDLM